MKNKFIFLSVFFSGCILAENDAVLQTDLKKFTTALETLEKNLKGISSEKRLKELESKINLILKQKATANPMRIERLLFLVNDYEELKPSQKKLEYYLQQAAELFLTYFAKNAIQLSRQDLTEKISKDFKKTLEFEKIREDVKDYLDDLPEGSLKEEIQKWLKKQDEADKAIQIMNAVLKGFDLSLQPIRYVGYPDPNNPILIQNKPFSSLLYQNYKIALEKAEEILSGIDEEVLKKRKYLNQLLKAIGNEPEARK